MVRDLRSDLPRYAVLGMIAGVVGIGSFTLAILALGRTWPLFVGLYAAIVLFAVAGFLAVRTVA